MKNNLVITNRKVANLTDFRETIELKGMQFFFSCIFLIKIDVENDTLIACLFNNACVVFINVKEPKYAF